MSRIVYVNGRYLPHRRAAIHVEDRGFQFADGVYEVIGVQGGAWWMKVRMWTGFPGRWRRCP
ncbi:MAG: hypothetical protein V3U99_01900 [Alphaproteobacteria bacterium]